MYSTGSSGRIWMKLRFSQQIFRKMVKYQILWKSVQWESNCLMRTDRRTDMTKLIVAFRNFANAPNNGAADPAFNFLGQHDL
jgi:hypothetical protein